MQTATYAPAMATGVFSVTYLLVLIPLLGSAVLLLGGRRLDKVGHILGTLVSIAAFAVGVALLFALLAKTGSGRSVDDIVYSAIVAGGYHVSVGFQVDQLSILFVLLITGVGSLIHVYSIGYMSHDDGRRRFFGYLNLFVAAMLLLVLADNYLTVYVGWEGVGLASYLLIGFWTHKPSAATAAKKAFIINRVGDVGLALAVMTMFATLGTSSFTGVFDSVATASPHIVTAVGLLLLLAGCGKSAQYPLQAWLLDAMEGPTPVSALIHAATMVTAGVYLIARSNPIFDHSTTALLVVAIVGTVTLVAGAIIGCGHDDIKKVLAASTMSQIGYMFLGVGLGPIGYAFAIIHLIAHGFFKAGLFLGAGSVMHGMNDEVDMRRFGGLGRVMTITYATFGLGYLALIGFPGLSGFFTKDKIIEAAFDKGGTAGTIEGTAALIAAALTAFYMTRLMAMTFWGEKRWDADAHPHESPSVMTIPMIILAFGSAFFGVLALYVLHLPTFLAPVFGPVPAAASGAPSAVVIMLIAFAMLVIGVGAAWYFFIARPVPATAPGQVSWVTRASRASLYGDAINEAVFMRPGLWLTRALVYFDNRGIDGAVNGLAALFGGTSARARRWQTGYVRSYAMAMLGGVAVLLLAVVLVRVGA
jgi:NADH-quinone oxidoreductase subunit L